MRGIRGGSDAPHQRGVWRATNLGEICGGQRVGGVCRPATPFLDPKSSSRVSRKPGLSLCLSAGGVSGETPPDPGGNTPQHFLKEFLKEKVKKKITLAAWLLGIKMGSQNPGGYIPPSPLRATAAALLSRSEFLSLTIYPQIGPN